MRRYVWFGCVLLAGVVLAVIASASVSARGVAGIPLTPFPTGDWTGPGGFVDPDRIVDCGVPVVYSGPCVPECHSSGPDRITFMAWSPCGPGYEPTPSVTAYWQPTPVAFETPTPGGTPAPTGTPDGTPTVTVTGTPDGTPSGTPTVTPEPGWWFEGPYPGFSFRGCDEIDTWHDEVFEALDRPMAVLLYHNVWKDPGHSQRAYKYLLGNPAYLTDEWAWDSTIDLERDVGDNWMVAWAGTDNPTAAIVDLLGFAPDYYHSLQPVAEGYEYPRTVVGSWYLWSDYPGTAICVNWDVYAWYVGYYGLPPATPTPTPTPSPTPTSDLCRIMQPAVLSANEGVVAHVQNRGDVEPFGLSPFGMGYISTSVTYTVSVGVFNMAYELDPELCYNEGWEVNFLVYRDGEWTDEPGDGGDVGIDPTITPGDCYVLVPQIGNPFNPDEFIFPGLELCLFYVDPNINLPLLGDPMPYLAPVIALLVGLLLHRMLRD